MTVERFGSGAKWEPVVGYSRTVRAGPFIFISGTTATLENGSIAGDGDAYEQMRQALSNMRKALELAGASILDVVQTRMYVTDIERWEEVGRAHEEVFGNIRPVTSMVEVSRLIDPAMLVEIEAVAYMP
jgi:enamine deaminase RidA (YjgF/YER057c/UK114 family)